MEDLFEHGARQQGSSFSDFFEMLFGGMGGEMGGFGTGPGTRTRTGPRASRADAETAISLPLESIHRGTTRKLTVRLRHTVQVIHVRLPLGARHDSRIRTPAGWCH